MRCFFIVLSVRTRSELIVFVLLDELKKRHEDYQLLAVAFALSMVNWVTDNVVFLPAELAKEARSEVLKLINNS